MKLIQKIQTALTPDLLKPEYRRRWNPDNPMYGHCYVASEVLYHMLGGSESGWNPWHGRDENGVVHWWLQRRYVRLDPTADQYQDRDPPYENGRRGAFLTKAPSKRARIVMERIS